MITFSSLLYFLEVRGVFLRVLQLAASERAVFSATVFGVQGLSVI